MKFGLTVLCFLILSTVTTARAQDVAVDFDRSSDFSRFKTYSWVSGVPVKNPFIDQQIKDSIDEQLKAKGLSQVKEDGDLSVIYFAAVETDVQVATSRWVTTGDWMKPITTGVSVKSQMWDVETGTLVVCLSNTSGKNLLWRGTARTMLEKKSKNEDLLEAMLEDARKVEKKIKKSVEKMFKKFPPRTSSE